MDQKNQYTAFLHNYSNIAQSVNFTQKKLQEIRKDLNQLLNPHPESKHLSLVATGSYGRNEASKHSDLDAFLFFGLDQNPHHLMKPEINKTIGKLKELVPKDPGDTGTFGLGEAVSFRRMTRHIGGEEDRNREMTRRMLFLLEGTYLYGENLFSQNRNALLEKYVDKQDQAEHLPLFLLNDIIRYYRTITTDFEYKVAEAGKSWGLRSIKLRFSRKLLYFGGLISAADVTQEERDSKIKKLSDHFSRTPLERLWRMQPGSGNTKTIFKLYDQFLECLNDEDKRNELDKLKKHDRNDCEVYSNLSQLSREFDEALLNWLNEYFPAKHDIHMKLIF